MSPMHAHSLIQPRQPLLDGQWRRRKHGFSRRVPVLIRNGIHVARVHINSMVSNTCCTSLLVQGTTDSPT